jgi:hypothetical protein
MPQPLRERAPAGLSTLRREGAGAQGPPDLGRQRQGDAQGVAAGRGAPLAGEVRHPDDVRAGDGAGAEQRRARGDLGHHGRDEARVHRPQRDVRRRQRPRLRALLEQEGHEGVELVARTMLHGTPPSRSAASWATFAR